MSPAARREANEPISDPLRAPESSSRVRSSRLHPRRRPIILIADDSPDAREIYATYFTRAAASAWSRRTMARR
jgi:hypothetical protein